MSKTVDFLLDNIIYPKICIVCKKKSKNDICSDCVKLVEKSSGPCEKTGGLFNYGDVCYFGRYAGKLKDAFSAYKFHGEIWRGASFGRLLFDMYGEYIKSKNYYCITYVPISKDGLKKRGFDQCYEIAVELSKKADIKLLKTISCNNQKLKQSSLDRFERYKNVSGRFVAIDNIDTNIIGKDILLIDDIITTGATLRECAELLSNFGVRKIDCMVFATGRSDLRSN